MFITAHTPTYDPALVLKSSHPNVIVHCPLSSDEKTAPANPYPAYNSVKIINLFFKTTGSTQAAVSLEFWDIIIKLMNGLRILVSPADCLRLTFKELQ